MELSVNMALAEIKLTDAKISKKTSAVMVDTNLAYLENATLKPQIKAEEELQAINDLYAYKEQIRAAIMKSNTITDLTIDGVTKTVYGWLVWKKEVGGQLNSLYSTINRRVDMIRQAVVKHPSFETKQGQEPKVIKTIYTVDQAKLLKSEEEIVSLLEKVDGAITQNNALTMITI